MDAQRTCACGNTAVASCESCGAAVCSLCVRRAGPRSVCLACRPPVERAATRRVSHAETLGALRTRRRLVLVPAVAVAFLCLVATVSVSVIEMARTSAEQRAERALRGIAEAEEAWRRGAGRGSYATLGELAAARLLALPHVRRHHLRIDLPLDRKSFVAHAVALDDSVRHMSIDARGRIVFEADVPPEEGR